MTAKHTPGPWTFSMDQQFGDVRFYVSQSEGAPYTPDYSDVATLIAETVSGERRLIQEANARLIAAAPDMLEALIECIEYTDKDALAKAKAAIAKATGESA